MSEGCVGVVFLFFAVSVLLVGGPFFVIFDICFIPLFTFLAFFFIEVRLPLHASRFTLMVTVHGSR